MNASIMSFIEDHNNSSTSLKKRWFLYYRQAPQIAQLSVQMQDVQFSLHFHVIAKTHKVNSQMPGAKLQPLRTMLEVWEPRKSSEGFFSLSPSLSLSIYISLHERSQSSWVQCLSCETRLFYIIWGCFINGAEKLFISFHFLSPFERSRMKVECF